MKRTLLLVSFLIVCVFLFAYYITNDDNQQKSIEKLPISKVETKNEDKEELLTVHSYKSDTKFTLKDVTNAFEKSKLHIVPQVDAGYPKLNDVKPKAYELKDGLLFIYVFNKNEEVNGRLHQVQDVNFPKFKVYIYEVNNVLIVYLPGTLNITPPELANEIDANIQKTIQEMLCGKQR